MPRAGTRHPLTLITIFITRASRRVKGPSATPAALSRRAAFLHTLEHEPASEVQDPLVYLAERPRKVPPNAKGGVSDVGEPLHAGDNIPSVDQRR